MQKEEDGILLERYLDGDMDASEREAFERRIEDETDLAAALEERRLLHHFLSIKTERDALKAQLPKLSEEFFKDKPQAVVRPLGGRRLLLRVAAAAALIALLLLLWQPWQVASPERLAERFIAPAPLEIGTERGSDDASFAEAETLYNTKQYAQAIPQLEAYLASETGRLDNNARLALGIAHLQTGQYETADGIFHQLAQSSWNRKEEGYWWLALSALKRADVAAAKGYLSNIKGGPLQDKASQLMGKMERWE
jgi:hypothetical protein